MARVSKTFTSSSLLGAVLLVSVQATALFIAIHPTVDNSSCVTASAHAVGAPIVIAPCAAEKVDLQYFISPSNPVFNFGGGHQLAVGGATPTGPLLCIIPDNNAVQTYGTGLVLGECDLSGQTIDQIWAIGDSGSYISNANYGLSVFTLPGGNLTAGNQLQITENTRWVVGGNGVTAVNQTWTETYI
uniref:Ricin B lectin domain-containing protein n=1 Tax=Mycena chlorophos TaxID=658473 RepID=A0ABQ0LZF5_MYCCL|nr:predicted protein [Mycena chlorophos]